MPAAFLLVILGTAIGIDRYGVQEHARPAEVIIVLGARVYPGGVPGDSLSSRTQRGVALFQQGMAPRMLFTGGIGDYAPAESVVASRLARALGVPAAAIFREERSSSTRGNAYYAAMVCRAHGWRSAIVVSDPYHLCRARYLFRREGLIVSTSPALQAVRHRRTGDRLYWTLRETLLLYREMLQDAVAPGHHAG